MAEFFPARSWKAEFARSTEAERYRDIIRRHDADQRRKANDKDEKDRDEREQDFEDVAFAVMASETDIDAYLVTTAHYQTATYDAIIQNEELIQAARREREALFEQAYVLPNGRRVFESEDGERVFDENGAQVDPSVASADDIEDWRPRFEQWQRNGDTLSTLEAERTELQEYLQKVEDARERLEQGEISQREFDAIKKDLTEMMPERVRDNLPDEYQPEHDNELQDELAMPAAPLSRPGPMPSV